MLLPDPECAIHFSRAKREDYLEKVVVRIVSVSSFRISCHCLDIVGNQDSKQASG